jgi:2-keto-4-pentenoate hydratase
MDKIDVNLQGRSDRVQRAARRLAGARRARVLLKELTPDCRPTSLGEAFEVQNTVTQMLGERVRGWKVAAGGDSGLMRGALLESVCFAAGSEIASSLAPYLGVEAEVAFRLDADLPGRWTPYTRDEVAYAVSACPAIEVIHSRFVNFDVVTSYERVADHLLNGAFVYGPALPGWTEIDLRIVHVRLEVDGIPVVESIGGHPSVHPLLPVVDLANAFRHEGGLKAGQLVTTGSFTGLVRINPGRTVRAAFSQLGEIQARFT